jgi:hypothetical protein
MAADLEPLLVSRDPCGFVAGGLQADFLLQVVLIGAQGRFRVGKSPQPSVAA